MIELTFRQATTPPSLGKLSAPFLSIKFDGDYGMVQSDHFADSLKDAQNVLARDLPHLRYLSLQVAVIPLQRTNMYNLKKLIHSTWWRVRRYEADGEKQVLAEAITQQTFEKVCDRLRGMDYRELASLKPEEIE